MKILLATSVVMAWPYIQELTDELEGQGAKVTLLNINDVGRLPLITRLAFKAGIVGRCPALRRRAFVAAVEHRLSLMPSDFDVINIHFADPIFAQLTPALKRHGRALVTTIWGADFLLADPAGLDALARIFTASDAVTSNNPEVSRKICAWRPETADQIRIVRFGLRSLDVITQLTGSESREETLNKLGLPQGKTVVACGYNAIREQNHFIMAEAFATLSPSARSKLFALLPMTYPADPSYVQEVRSAVEQSGIEFSIIDETQSIDYICRTRIASDYAVNIQTTDSLSASIQEHMFAGSNMIVGAWLPYGVFEELGVPLRRVYDAADIAALLETAAASGAPNRSRPAYSAKLYDYASWRANIGEWLALYESFQRAA